MVSIHETSKKKKSNVDIRSSALMKALLLPNELIYSCYNVPNVYYSLQRYPFSLPLKLPYSTAKLPKTTMAGSTIAACKTSPISIDSAVESSYVYCRL